VEEKRGVRHRHCRCSGAGGAGKLHAKNGEKGKHRRVEERTGLKAKTKIDHSSEGIQRESIFGPLRTRRRIKGKEVARPLGV